MNVKHEHPRGIIGHAPSLAAGASSLELYPVGIRTFRTQAFRTQDVSYTERRFVYRS